MTDINAEPLAPESLEMIEYLRYHTDALILSDDLPYRLDVIIKLKRFVNEFLCAQLDCSPFVCRMDRPTKHHNRNPTRFASLQKFELSPLV